MARNHLKDSFKNGRFVVTAELTGGPGYNFTPIEKFLKAFADNQGQHLPSDFTLAGITVAAESRRRRQY